MKAYNEDETHIVICPKCGAEEETTNAAGDLCSDCWGKEQEEMEQQYHEEMKKEMEI